jgi:outer membrane protein TolC
LNAGLVACLLLLCFFRPACAAESGSRRLAADPSLTFTVLLQQALQRSPEYLELAERDAEAKAHVAAARSWLAGRPSLEASYANDRPRTAVGFTELEYGVQLPLWRPGERRDAARQGRTLAEHADAWRSLLELTIAGRLRDSLASLESAERLLEIERQAVVDTQQLVTSVERLFDAGEMAVLDVTQARTSLLAQRRAVLQAEAALANAEAALMRLTGLSARPAAARPSASPSGTAAIRRMSGRRVATTSPSPIRRAGRSPSAS